MPMADERYTAGQGANPVDDFEVIEEPKNAATGPRTLSGKERSKNNALKHGIFAKTVVLRTESRAEFDNLLNGFQEDFHPVGAFEEALVEKLSVLFWRYRRLMAAEVSAIEER